jgi:hypothetical protein
MKFAVMSLKNLRLMEHEAHQPLYFETYDEAEIFIHMYGLVQVAIVQLDGDEEVS